MNISFPFVMNPITFLKRYRARFHFHYSALMLAVKWPIYTCAAMGYPLIKPAQGLVVQPLPPNFKTGITVCAILCVCPATGTGPIPTGTLTGTGARQI